MGRKNATSDTTRAELLEAAAALLAERGFDTTMGVRLTEVTARAGRTTGAAYQLWPRQHDFHRDLALYVARRSSRVAVADPVERVRDQLADWRFHAFVQWWAPALQDPELRAALAAAQRDDEVAAVSTLLDGRGRRPRPPHTIESVAQAMSALVDGFTLRAGLSLGSDPAELDLALVGDVVDAVLDRLTEPAPDEN